MDLFSGNVVTPSRKNKRQMTERELTRYCGIYYTPRFVIELTVKNGRLFCKFMDKSQSRFYPIGTEYPVTHLNDDLFTFTPPGFFPQYFSLGLSEINIRACMVFAGYCLVRK